MAWYRCGGGGMPSGLQADMDAVLNKKFGTSESYPPSDWAPTVNLLGPLPERTASGAIAHIEDGADRVPIKSWLVSLPASLSGYSGVTAYQAKKNLMDNVGYFPTGNTLTSYYANFTSNTNLPVVRLIEGVTYTLSMDIISDNEPFNISVGCGQGTYLSDIATAFNLTSGRNSISFTPTASNLANGNILAFRAPRYGGSAREFTFSIENVQLEVGSTATSYEAYEAPTQYTASFDTIYGGQVDLVSGLGEAQFKKVTDFSGLIANGTSSTGAYRYRLNVADCLVYSDAQAISNTLTFRASFNGAVGEFYNASGYLLIFLAEDNVTDAITALSGTEIVYPITPTPIEFTPIPTPETALETNNFWAIEGESEVTYRADIDLLLGGQ